MSEITVNIYDYLSKDEIKAIAEQELRVALRRHWETESDMKRVFSNLSYEYIRIMIDEVFDGKLEDALRSKIPSIINDLSAYTVFKRKDAWDKEDSIAYKHLQAAMEDSKDLIYAKVTELVDKWPFETDIQDEMYNALSDVIFRRLFDREKEAGEYIG